MRTSPIASALLAAWLLMLTACGKPDPSVRPAEDMAPDAGDVLDMPADVTDAPEDMPDLGDMADMTPREAADGHVQLTYVHPDRRFPHHEAFLNGAFAASVSARSVVDPVGWWDHHQGWGLTPAGGQAELPVVGESSDAEVAAEAVADARDAGPALRVGDAIAAPRVAGVSGVIYASALEDATTLADALSLPGARTLAVDGGADISAAEAADAVELPAPLVLTSCDPLQDLPLRQDQPLVLSWAPTLDARDTMLITLTTPSGTSRRWHLDDALAIFDASAALADAGMPLEDGITITMTRRLEQITSLGAARVRVVTARTQRLFGRVVKPLEVTPDVWRIGAREDVRIAAWDDPFVSAARLRVDAGADVQTGGAFVEDCRDQVLAFQAEAPEGTPSREVTLRLGGQDGGLSRQVSGVVWLAEQLPVAGDCPSALDEGPQPDGVFFSTDRGLPRTPSLASACGAAFTGRVQHVPLRLRAGEVLRARLRRTDGHGAVALVRGCDQAETLTCATAPTPGQEAALTYTATADEDILLAIGSDAAPDAPGAPFAVKIERERPPVTITPDALDAGQAATLTVRSHVGPLDGATIDLGPDLTVQAVNASGDTATVDVLVAATPSRASATVQLTASGSAYAAPNALALRPRAEAATCAPGADPITTSGVIRVIPPAGSNGSLDACQSTTLPGPEVYVPITVPASHLLRARVEGPAGLRLLRTCEATSQALCVAPTSERPAAISWIGPATATTVWLVVDTTRPDAPPPLLHVELAPY